MSNFKDRVSEIERRFQSAPAEEAIHMLSVMYVGQSDNAHAAYACRRCQRVLEG